MVGIRDAACVDPSLCSKNLFLKKFSLAYRKQKGPRVITHKQYRQSYLSHTVVIMSRMVRSTAGNWWSGLLIRCAEYYL